MIAGQTIITQPSDRVSRVGLRICVPTVGQSMRSMVMTSMQNTLGVSSGRTKAARSGRASPMKMPEARMSGARRPSDARRRVIMMG